LIAPEDVARFWRYVQVGDSCWPWLGNRMVGRCGGYGRIYVAGKLLKAHRVSYEIHFGPIPDGMYVCHHCDNRPCVNPAHLFVGTHADNMADMGRKGCTSVRYGENNAKAKVRREDVAVIRTSKETYRQLAERYGISTQQVYRIKCGESWGPSSL